jgi:hypothetical protein
MHGLQTYVHRLQILYDHGCIGYTDQNVAIAVGSLKETEDFNGKETPKNEHVNVLVSAY